MLILFLPHSLKPFHSPLLETSIVYLRTRATAQVTAGLTLGSDQCSTSVESDSVTSYDFTS